MTEDGRDTRLGTFMSDNILDMVAAFQVVDGGVNYDMMSGYRFFLDDAAHARMRYTIRYSGPLTRMLMKTSRADEEIEGF